MRAPTMILLALALAVSQAAAEPRLPEPGTAAVDLSMIPTVTPTDTGFELSAEVSQELLGQLGLRAVTGYLRAYRSQLFSNVSLGVTRYRHARVQAQTVTVSLRPDREDTLAIDIRAQVVADRQDRSLSCELVDWRTRCRSRWHDRGTSRLATIDALGELRLSPNEGAPLGEDPFVVDVVLRRISGSLALAALSDIGLAIDLDPPYLAERRTLSLPRLARFGLRRYRDYVPTSLYLEQADEGRIAIRASITRPPTAP